jgi:hypothetical protein
MEVSEWGVVINEPALKRGASGEVGLLSLNCKFQALIV